MSLLDITPTVLQLLGIAPTPAAAAATPARSVLAPADPARLLPFSCYYDNAGRGFVVGHTKVVWVPETDQTFAFDLEHDPDERDPKPLTSELRSMLATVKQMIEAHRASKWLMTRDAFDDFPNWKCPAGRPCTPINALGR